MIWEIVAGKQYELALLTDSLNLFQIRFLF